MIEVGEQIRAMQRADLSAVIALEQACELSSWGMDGYEKELSNPAALLLVATSKQQFAGYFAGRVMVDEFELFSIAVVSKLRRQGIGRKLLEAGLYTLYQRGIHRCLLEVRAANLAAQNLYRDYGFRPIGLRRDYYHHPLDDALVMALEVIIPLSSAD